MNADEQPEAKAAPGSITALVEQRKKNASLQDQEERLGAMAGKVGYWYDNDIQKDIDAWYGNFSVTLEYQRSRFHEREDSE
jgi:hypothetical protein